MYFSFILTYNDRIVIEMTSCIGTITIANKEVGTVGSVCAGCDRIVMTMVA
jgi:hypothetical protein